MTAWLSSGLWHLVSPLSPEDRHTVIAEALSFLPGSDSELCTTVGPVRAELAAVWESHLKQPVPIEALRSLGIGRTHATRQNILEAADCSDGRAFDTAILSLIDYLEQAIANHPSWQRSLFPSLTLDPGNPLPYST